MRHSLVRRRLALLLSLTWAVSPYALAGPFDAAGGVGAAHAVAQVSAATWFIYAVSALSGLIMVGVCVMQAVKNASSGAPDASAFKPLFGALLGGVMVVFPIIVEILGRTAYGPSGASPLAAFAIDDELAQSITISGTGIARFLPPAALITLMSVLFIIGLISIFFAFRKAFTAVMYGSESQGTSLHHKMPGIIVHVFFGLALLAPIRSHCLLAMTFGQPDLCAY